VARPPKERRVEYIPEIKYFKPAGVPMREIDDINLTMDEVEAIRLKDLEGLTQKECSDRMEISRPTFQRVLIAARAKIARALIGGKAIRFQGGDYRLASKKYHCDSCGNTFNAPYHWRGRGGRRRNQDISCPECGNPLDNLNK